MINSGGFPADLDAITATAADVIASKIIVDSNGDPVTGTIPDLSNKTLARSPNSADVKDVSNYWSTAEGYGGDLTIEVPHTGYFHNTRIQQAVYGIHPSVVKAGALIGANAASGFARGTFTSDANATEDKILSGYSGYVNGNKINGKLTVQSVVSFNVAQYSNLTLIASWAKPAKGPWSGLRILCKQGGYPANVNDGALFYEGASTSATKQLTAGTWYFRAWNYITTNQGRLYGNYHSATASNSEIKGQQTFTSSGVFTVSANVRSVDAFCVGGGGGVSQATNNCSGGGGGGYTQTLKGIAVTPGQQIYVTVGAGGQARSDYDDYMNRIETAGSSSSFGTFVTANGGNGGYEYNGGAGGSGGGQRGLDSGNDDRRWAGNGGSDGSNGYLMGQYGSTPPTGASGQHTTTRAFGEASGTLYSGGGGGGTSDNYTVGAGGAGGGGDGAGRNYNKPVSGAAGTGGGGGGTFYQGEEGDYPRQYSYGGSGIVIVRWGY